MLIFSTRSQHAVIAASLILPLLLLVLLSAPAWLVWPFLPVDRRKTVLQFLDHLLEWVRLLAGTGDPDAKNRGSQHEPRLAQTITAGEANHSHSQEPYRRPRAAPGDGAGRPGW